VDCALWDLECQRAGQRAWALAGIGEPHPVTTVYTLSLDTATRMAEEAERHADFSVLKVKLNGDNALERLTAIRAARPDAELLVDANGSWDVQLLEQLGDELARLEIAMVEQPLPRGADQPLAGLKYPVPLVADESCQGLAELDAMAGLYQGVNIKLDKCGGLTEALALQKRAHALGLETMVGNMLGSSLAMAPGFLIAQGCRWVDLDGPLWQRADRAPAIRFEHGLMHAPAAALWG
jgi:L-alanine-DL-glutamate epimerase-like enolase superfamily enzyme